MTPKPNLDKRSEETVDEFISSEIKPLNSEHFSYFLVDDQKFPEDYATGDGESFPEAPTRERMQWANQWDFLLSCISMSVGLGNVWRFPLTAYENGGGAFLIPYLIVLFVFGRPIYFLELVLGQFSSYTQVKAWKIVPFFKGVGYGSMISFMSGTTYYAAIMGLCIYYFFASFQALLPWANCDETWAGNGSCNGSLSATNVSVAEMYYSKAVIRELVSIEHGIGYPEWKLCACLAFAWLFVYLSLLRGIHTSGKVAWFTSIFPYIVMFTLLIRGLTLKGAWDGIMFFITPRWEKLYEPKVWYAAITQCFFSLNACFGSIIMFSSHNDFHHNIYKDAWIVTGMDTLTSFLAGFTIFAVLGNLASELGTDVENVIQNGGGAGLAFISYADAISKFDWCPQLFAALFFLMLFTLGQGSCISSVGTIITIFCDSFPQAKRWKVTIVVCVLGCAIGTVYTTPGGQFVLNLVDFYGASFVIFTTGLLEVVGIAWIYGVYNYVDDIEFMLGIRLGCYWKICWGILIPVSMIIILMYTLLGGVTPTHNGVEYPITALVGGWLIAGVALISLPIGAMHSVAKSPRESLKQKFFATLKPSDGWGPMDPRIRREWIKFKQSRPQISLLERLKQNKL